MFTESRQGHTRTGYRTCTIPRDIRFEKSNAVAFYLTRQLIGEYVGLEPIGLDLWQLYFGELKLGIVDERLKSVIRPK